MAALAQVILEFVADENSQLQLVQVTADETAWLSMIEMLTWKLQSSSVGSSASAASSWSRKFKVSNSKHDDTIIRQAGIF